MLIAFFCRNHFYNDWPLVVLNVAGRSSSIGTLALCYIYSAEIFPTVIRNVGIGSSSVWVRILDGLLDKSDFLEPNLAAVNARLV